MELPVLIENSAVDVRVAAAVFVGLVYSIADGVITILMDGGVRIGTPITLIQGEVCEAGRVQTCQPLPDGCGFKLTVSSLNSQSAWSQGFEWPGHSASQFGMAC